MLTIEPEKEKEILHECLINGNKEIIVEIFWDLIHIVVNKKLNDYYCQYNLLYTKSNVDGIVNEVFIRLFDRNCKRLRLYDPNNSLDLKGWIILIANQAVINAVKKADPLAFGKANKKISYDEMLGEIKDEEESIIIEQDEEKELLKNKIKELRPRYKLILTLYYYDEVPMKEISEIFDASVETIGRSN